MVNDYASGRRVFDSELPLIEELIGLTCKRHRLGGDETEDFYSYVMLKLIEKNYGRLRKFKGASSLRTYLTTVLQRLFLDYRSQKWGKWRPSASARRLGEAAVLLETLLYRDGFGFEEAEQILRSNHRLTISPDELRRLVDDCPMRRRRQFLGEEVLQNLPTPGPPDGALERERACFLQELGSKVNDALGELGEESRLILRMRFQEGLSVLQIARALHREPKKLYYRFHKILKRLRAALEGEGVDRSEVLEALGSPRVEIDLAYLSYTGQERPTVSV
jgi:RNA polymerase sigma factor (sigma-70 family)